MTTNIITPFITFLTRITKKWTTKEGLIGNYDYKYLFTPNLPFMKKKNTVQPFYPLNSEMPIFMGMLLGLAHCLAMVGGLVSPPMTYASLANFDEDTQQYLISVSLIASGILTIFEITRIRIYKTNFFIGTGMIQVLGSTFSAITVADTIFPLMYSTGYCPSDSDGNELPCPRGYGAFLASCCICSLTQMIMSCIPPKILQKLFPPIVTGPVILVMGGKLVASGFKDWLGGSSCMTTAYCPNASAPKPLPWGSAEFIGLGFLVYCTIIIVEKYGSPIMHSSAILIGLLVGCIVAAACGYFDRTAIDEAPVITFLWVKTFPLKLYAPAILPMIATNIAISMETIGNITAGCDVSRLEVEGKDYDSRIQGGLLSDGLAAMLSCLFTNAPMGNFAQNNGVISMTKCANRKVGYWCCFWLILMGIWGKFAAAFVVIPKGVLGGMTTFLYSSVAVTGLAVIGRSKFSRRDRFILTASMCFGYGSIMVSNWFSDVFTYKGSNENLTSFLEAITVMMDSPQAITAFTGVIVNQVIREDEDSEENDTEVMMKNGGVTVIEGEAASSSQVSVVELEKISKE